MKNKLFLICLCCLFPFIHSACVQEMGTHGRLRYQQEDLSGLTSSPRLPPEGTVSQTSERMTVIRRYTREGLSSGRELYQVYCMPCHGMSGQGDGMIVQRGFLAPPSYHTDRLRKASDEHYYEVITQGYGAMYSYSDRVSPEERWAIIDYIRALQLSQNADLNELTAEEKEKLSKLQKGIRETR